MSLTRPRGGQAWRGAGTLAAVAALCILVQLGSLLGPSRWIAAALAPAPRVAELVVHFSVLPRITVALLAGAGLAASGVLFQHVLSNPLASPVTLGVPAGAQLGLTALALAAPGGLARWGTPAALAGGLVVVAVTLAVAAAHRYAPLVVVLAGLATGLVCGALAMAARLFDQENLSVILLWNAGSLDQIDWSVPRLLLPEFAVLAAILSPLVRPVALLGLGDAGARAIGLAPAWIRVAALGIAVALAACVTAVVGNIAFVDLAAPLLARRLGARRLGMQLAVAPLLGGCMLVIVDAAVHGFDAATGSAVPSGAVTALLAAPLVLWLLPGLAGGFAEASPQQVAVADRRATRPLLLGLVVVLAVALVLACMLGRSSPFGDDLTGLLPWRAPRAVEAGAAGAMLATAGALLQRTTGNALASPEILGLGAAVIAGFTAAVFLLPQPSAAVLVAAGAAAASALGMILVGVGLRSGTAPTRLLLTGVTLTACLTAGVTACTALNDSRSALLIGFLAGSTAGAGAMGATMLALVAVVLVPTSLLLRRGLDLIPLGDATARGLGVPLGATRAAHMGLAALLTAIATLAVGPLTFVGLLGPHLVRRMGLHGAGAEIGGAALLGAIIMIAADWVGRIVCAPFEIPAGLVAAVLGGPYLLLQLRRR